MKPDNAPTSAPVDRLVGPDAGVDVSSMHQPVIEPELQRERVLSELNIMRDELIRPGVRTRMRYSHMREPERLTAASAVATCLELVHSW